MHVLLKWTKKQLKLALSVLHAVRNRFPETNQFIDNTLKEEWEKERITGDEVIFFKFKSKKVAQINIFFVFRFSTKGFTFLFIDMERLDR